MVTLGLWGASAALSPTAASPTVATGADQAQETLLIVGDSLSSEYGIRRGTGWVQLLRERLAESDAPPVAIINASISGDTTSSGVTRLPTLLAKHQPSVVLIELGGNDALRGLSLDMTRDNLNTMVELSQAAGAEVVLAGMQIPPNYGPAYTKQFRELYRKVTQENNCCLGTVFFSRARNRSISFYRGWHSSRRTCPADLVEQRVAGARSLAKRKRQPKIGIKFSVQCLIAGVPQQSKLAHRATV